VTMTVQVHDHLPQHHLEHSLRTDARAGLSATPKTLPPKWFYDKAGSELFEQITELPEYYPTRAEREVLQARAGEVAALSRARTLVELGSGSSTKTRLLIDALRHQGTLEHYVAMDVSESALVQAGMSLAEDYPGLLIEGLVADFEAQLHLMPDHPNRLVGFLGGTIGNFEPGPRARFLAGLGSMLGDGDFFLMGTDLVKPVEVLVPAYDDHAGVTAEFNKNVLRVLNRELGADFDPDAFEHVAVWDADREWIEMRLRASRDMVVDIPALDDLEVRFAAGEELRTEISAKFHLEGVRDELAAAGFDTVAQWTDAERRFAVTLANVPPHPGAAG
jgi:L-histidine Nalpha-methyltransferase